jgi:uncharacterized protein
MGDARTVSTTDLTDRPLPPADSEAGSSIVRARPGPVKPGERIDALDIVRGFALLGVLAMNMLAFAGPTYLAAPWEISTTWWDRLTELALLTGAESAFYSIFSILFGLGFALQIERALARGQSRWLFARRMLVLLTVGVGHAFFIWDGDILLPYATTGLVLLAFARTPADKTLRWAIGLGAAMFIVAGSLMSLSLLDDYEATTAADVADEVALLQDGSFIAVADSRLSDAVWVVVPTLISVPWFLALFLTGAWLMRSGRVADWRNQGPFLKSVLRVSVPVAVVAKGLYGLLILAGEQEVAEAMALPVSNMVGGPALGITYASLVVLALQNGGAAARALGHLAPVGRMALTNYLSQSLIAVTFFYGWGLGFYGRWGPAVGLLLTVALFAIQIVWSRLWLSRFKFGPAEWAWRTLTYGRPIRG